LIWLKNLGIQFPTVWVLSKGNNRLLLLCPRS
jgi:hypothetical protein